MRAFPSTSSKSIPFLSHQPTVLITGCIFSSVVLFSNSIGVGGFVFNVAGNVIFTGCVFNSNGAFYQKSGIGYLSFNSAGLSIFTVCVTQWTCLSWVDLGWCGLPDKHHNVLVMTQYAHTSLICLQGCISNFQLGAAVFFGGGLGMFTGAVCPPSRLTFPCCPYPPSLAPRAPTIFPSPSSPASKKKPHR